MDLGTKIKNIRYNNNLSQEEMSKILKVNRNYLSRIETNKSLPTAEVLIKLAECFSISIDSLLGLDMDSKEVNELRNGKIKKITQYCNSLSNQELDFIINVLCVLSNNSKVYK